MTAQSRFTVYASSAMIDALRITRDDGPTRSRSSRINAIAIRYMAIIASSLAQIEMRADQWTMIAEAIGDRTLREDEIPMLAQIIAFAPAREDEAPAFRAQLAHSINLMPLAWRVAITEAVERLRAHGDKDQETAFLAAGIITHEW